MGIGPTASEAEDPGLARTNRRPRRYVRRWAIGLARPLLRFSTTRDAYVLRVVGGRAGPVLRVERRRHALPIDGPDRRRTAARAPVPRAPV